EAAYSASKFAQVGLTEALSVELAPFGVGVSMVNPGPVATGFFDARGHAYERKTPKPVSADAVAAVVMAAVEKNRLEPYVPRWLRQASLARHLVPPIYRVGTRSTFRRELTEERGKR
ncbi:MAG: SDR family NAD(P)-dependent oxidoreductase, partial [Actinobacteria bacterium]|nr:SDR family NAD(P)-dependent oxidoreductase [Actinomycetota bacterium]